MSLLTDLIAEEKKKQRLSGRQLAELAGISSTSELRISKGESKKPKVDTLKRLALALGINPYVILEAAGYIEGTSNSELHLSGLQRLTKAQMAEVQDFIYLLLNRNGK